MTGDSFDDPNQALPPERGETALAELFDRYRDRLRGAVKVRLDPRLQGRVDPSDIIQEAWMEARQRLDEFRRDRPMSPFLWIRFLTIQRLLIANRRHMQAQQRDVRRELRLGPQASSLNLASLLAASDMSPSQLAEKSESREQLARALEQMDELDREVLALKHFERMDNHEVAELLEITFAAASRRYYRALKKLKAILTELTGDDDEA